MESSALLYTPCGEPPSPRCPRDVTLVWVGVLDTFHQVTKILDTWEGPASLAVYLNGTDILKLQQITEGSRQLTKKSNVTIHVVYARQGVRGIWSGRVIWA